MKVGKEKLSEVFRILMALHQNLIKAMHLYIYLFFPDFFVYYRATTPA